MTFDELAAAYALLATSGVGYVAAGDAIRTAHRVDRSLRELIALETAQLLDELPPGTANAAQALGRCEDRTIARQLRMLERLSVAGGRVLLVTDDAYPQSLLQTLGKNAPPLLACLGNEALLEQAGAAVVGARDASAETIGYAEDCARIFAAEGVPVVSGSAKGTDEAAHGAALAAGGNSVFVLPVGILRYRGPDVVREALDDGRALLVSEFAPDAQWATHAAIVRNSTISAFSRIVCAFEPRNTGGSIRTVEAALAQGKSVLIHCTCDQYRVETRLLQSGARALPVHEPGSLRQALMKAWTDGPQPEFEQGELF
jgi:DNA processing protein